MDQKPQTVRVKHDKPICAKCQDTNLKVRPDGSYSCKRCGYDSAK